MSDSSVGWVSLELAARVCREHGYRIVKLSGIDGPVDADMAAWDGDGYRIVDELNPDQEPAA